MEELLSLTYVSSATNLFEGDQLTEMLAAWRPRNHAVGLTGMLLYSGGNIIQAIEGPEEAVEATFEMICADPRHRGVLELLREPIGERAFPDWSMGFRDVGPGTVPQADGFNPFLQRRPDGATARTADPADPVDPAADVPAASAYRLLKLFRRSMH